MVGRTVAIDVLPTADDVANAAANRIVAALAARTGLSAAVCLPGGSTPRRLFNALAAPSLRNLIAWNSVHWFVGDERRVPEDDIDSNMGAARRMFLDALAPAQNVHSVRFDVAAPAEFYEAELRQFKATVRDGATLFDCVVLGIGSDGHTASLFPGANALVETTKWVVEVPTPSLPPLVPRITLTPPCLQSTRQMMFLVTGVEKRTIMNSVAAGDDLPATRLSAAFGSAMWLIDRAASSDHRQRSDVNGVNRCSWE